MTTYVPIRVLSVLFGSSLLLAPVAASAQITPSLTAEGGVNLSASASTTVVVTRKSAQAELNASATSTAAREAAPGTAVSSEARLRAHAAQLIREDAKLSAVALSSEGVSLEYRGPARLLGVFPLGVPIQVVVAADGTATVEYPWYGFLLTTDEATLTVKLQAAADRALRGNDAAKGSISASAQSRLADSLHATLESEFEADASAD